jgi:hypothetical protein
MADGCHKKGVDSGTVPQVTLDHIEGLQGTGNIQTGVPITFYIRFQNNTGSYITGSSNGFRVYSPNGAQWDPITWDTANVGLDTLYDFGIFFSDLSVTGSGADTVGLAGLCLFKSGIPNGFDEVVFLISTQIDAVHAGRTICLDSAFYPPGGEWMWSTDGGTVYPTWDGPHCFRIVSPP